MKTLQMFKFVKIAFASNRDTNMIARNWIWIDKAKDEAIRLREVEKALYNFFISTHEEALLSPKNIQFIMNSLSWIDADWVKYILKSVMKKLETYEYSTWLYLVIADICNKIWDEELAKDVLRKSLYFMNNDIPSIIRHHYLIETMQLYFEMWRYDIVRWMLQVIIDNRLVTK